MICRIGRSKDLVGDHVFVCLLVCLLEVLRPEIGSRSPARGSLP